MTQLHFSTHADLKNIIGQDLINDDSIAISELVKNSIDASASKIIADFDPNSILIADNGTGMSEDDIKNKWLNIAYSEKKYSTNGKYFAGNKGVGRFACDRLGEKLDLLTSQNGSQWIHLQINWVDFENKSNYKDVIQNVDIQYKKISSDAALRIITNGDKGSARILPEKNGTLLFISHLRQQWTRDKLLQLKRSLERFMNPMASIQKNAVKVTLRSEHEKTVDKQEEPHNQINGVIKNQVFSKLKFKTTYIECQIDKSGKLITTELFHAGERIYRLVERNDNFPLLKNIHIVLHYMNPYKKAYFKRLTGLNLVEFGSVFLFINGYRVPPYGDRNNDWLQLDNRKSQGTARYLGSRELLGFINITDENNEFRIVSNREGVVKDLKFSQLVSNSNPQGFFIHLLTRFERFVVDGLDWDSVPDEIRKKLRSGNAPSNDIDEIYKEDSQTKQNRIASDLFRIVGASPDNTIDLEINPDVLNTITLQGEEKAKAILEKLNIFEPSTGKNIKQALNAVVEQYNRQKKSLEASKSKIANLEGDKKSLAIKNITLVKQLQTQETELYFSKLATSSDREQLMLLHHQSSIYAQTSKNFLEAALRTLRSMPDHAKLQNEIEKALISTKKIITINAFATKANFKLNIETIRSDISNFIKEYIENVASETTAHSLKIHVTKSPSTPFEMTFKPIDIAIVIDNLTSNSIRAQAKNIYVDISQISNKLLSIHYRDDGVGLTKEIQPPEKIFDRGVTTTKGSGLGLYHISETIKSLNGTIKIMQNLSSGFGLEIDLKK